LSGKDIETFQKARNYCFLLLKFRPRSEKEIYNRLKRKKFDESIILAVCELLKDNGLIDDKAFSKAWIESRLKKPFGFRRITQELRLKGIEDNLIESSIAEIRGNYSEEDTVLKVAKGRLNKLNVKEPDKAKKNLYAYLLRRGFASEIIINVINQLIF